MLSRVIGGGARAKWQGPCGAIALACDESKVARMPAHWRARRDPLYSEEALAWLEAGQVVVAYEFGWWLRRGGVRIGAWAHTRHQRHAGAGTVLARCCVSLAGLVAEQRFHNQQSWHFAGDVLKEIRNIRADVNENISLYPWDLRAVAVGCLTMTLRSL